MAVPGERQVRSASGDGCTPDAPELPADAALVATEWGVAAADWTVTACESEDAARQLQAAHGGELVYRQTWITRW
jgi:hypothetical protein